MGSFTSIPHIFYKDTQWDFTCMHAWLLLHVHKGSCRSHKVLKDPRNCRALALAILLHKDSCKPHSLCYLRFQKTVMKYRGSFIYCCFCSSYRQFYNSLYNTVLIQKGICIDDKCSCLPEFYYHLPALTPSQFYLCLPLFIMVVSTFGQHAGLTWVDLG